MRLTILALAISALPLQAVAEAHSHTKTQRSHDAHQHGVGIMNVGVDGKSLLIELELPAMNVVGFEHQPKNAKQKAAIEQAAATLKEGRQLFDLPRKAKCQQVAAIVESELLSSDDHEKHHDDHEKHHDDPEKHHDDHEEHHDDHEEHHDDHEEHHDDHEKHHDDHEEHHEVHSEFSVHYEFQCRKPQKLDAIVVNLFKVLPGSERLDAQVISTEGQLGKKLTAKDNRLPLVSK